MPKTRRRNAAREQFWRDTVATWQRSGQSVRAFCAARGVSEATFFASQIGCRQHSSGGLGSCGGGLIGREPALCELRVDVRELTAEH